MKGFQEKKEMEHPDQNDEVSRKEEEKMGIEKMLREIEGMDQSKTYKEFLVDGALVACQYGKRVIKLRKNSSSFTYVGYDEVLTDKDRPTGTCGVCHAPQIFGNPGLEKKQKVISANESISGKQISDYGPECMMELSQVWQGTEKEMLVWDREDQTYRSIPTNESFLVCKYGGGCICPIDSGQKIKN